jgi:hypothetical protein
MIPDKFRDRHPTPLAIRQALWVIGIFPTDHEWSDIMRAARLTDEATLRPQPMERADDN